jgi:hypothetical protein
LAGILAIERDISGPEAEPLEIEAYLRRKEPTQLEKAGDILDR